MTLLLQRAQCCLRAYLPYRETESEQHSVFTAQTIKEDALTGQQGRPGSALVHPEPRAQCPDGTSSLQGAPHSC